MADNVEFESLVARYYEPLYQFAFSLARDESDACDLTQQTFCIWAAKGHQLRDASKVKTWLFTTLHREFLGVRRKQTRFPQVELEDAGAGTARRVAGRRSAGPTPRRCSRRWRGWTKFIRRPSRCFICRIAPTTKSRKSLKCRWAPSSRGSPAGSANCRNCWPAIPRRRRPEPTRFVNPNEAKTILLLYRPGTADAEDPQIAAALALAKQRAGTGALAGGSLRAAGGVARQIPANHRARRTEGTNHLRIRRRGS